MANFYKMVVKAVSTLVNERGDAVSEIKFSTNLSMEETEKELAKLNDVYFGRIDTMLKDAAEIIAQANKDDWFD